jgi:hypothetical protein
MRMMEVPLMIIGTLHAAAPFACTMSPRNAESAETPMGAMPNGAEYSCP